MDSTNNHYRETQPGDLSARKKAPGRPRKWPFYTMEVGATITVEDAEHHGAAKVSACRAGQLNGWKFKSAKMSNGLLLIKRVA